MLISSRNLQELDYTSPPLPDALKATPEKFRNDKYLNLIREAAENYDCYNNTAMENCQMLFPPSEEYSSSQIGIVLYGGALVDPRSYSVMAKALSEEYGFPVSIPIFANDIAYEGCNGTNRVLIASNTFPEVEKWVLAGHSMGGVGAQIDLWNEINKETERKIDGLVLMGSYITDVCGAIDFSQTNIPMALVAGSLDFIANKTKTDSAKPYLPVNGTQYIDIVGGNHANFGYYDDSLRLSIVGGDSDGNATIPRKVQHDLSIGAIANVAARMGLTLSSHSGENIIYEGGTSSANIAYVGSYSLLSCLIVIAFTIIIH